MHNQFIMSCSGSTQQKQENRQHCQTSDKCIKHLKISCFDLTVSASTQSNEYKHRNQRTFIKNIKTKNVHSCKTCKQKTFKTKKQCKKRLTMCILCIPTTQNSQWHLNCSQLNHPQIQSIQSKFQIQSQKTTPTCMNSNYLLKRNSRIWKKTRPLSHTQEKSSLAKNLCNKTVDLSLFCRLTTKKKPSSQRKKLHYSKLSLQRNTLNQCSSQNTRTKNQRLHFFQKKAQQIDSNYRLEIMSLTR